MTLQPAGPPPAYQQQLLLHQQQESALATAQLRHLLPLPQPGAAQLAWWLRDHQAASPPCLQGVPLWQQQQTRLQLQQDHHQQHHQVAPV